MNVSGQLLLFSIALSPNIGNIFSIKERWQQKCG